MAEQMSPRERAAARRKSHVAALELELAGVKAKGDDDERATAIEAEIKRVKSLKDTASSGAQQTRG